jgi:hypothetical protein
VAAQWRGNSLPAMNEVLRQTITKYKYAPAKAPASIPVNWESVSNKIDESNPQSENHFGQRI